MQYLVIAYDHDDALERRLEVRDAHVEGARKLMVEGKIVNAGALIEEEKMVAKSISASSACAIIPKKTPMASDASNS